MAQRMNIFIILAICVAIFGPVIITEWDKNR